MQVIAIFVELPPNLCYKERQPQVSGENVTNTLQYLGNGARYDVSSYYLLTGIRIWALYWYRNNGTEITDLQRP